MTTTDKICKAERYRVGKSTGWSGTFVVPFDGEFWQVELFEGDVRHLSLTNAERFGPPTYLVLAHMRRLFFDDESWIVQVYGTLPMSQMVQWLWEYPHPPHTAGGSE